VEEEAERYGPLLAAAELAGLRVGWLQLENEPAAASPAAVPPAAVPPAAARAGARRVVLAAAQATVSYKPRRGPAVLRDLLREHFLGFRLVLFQGPIPVDLASAPRLRTSGEGWIVEDPASQSYAYTTEGLIAALRRPNPWGIRARAGES
jgi:hypothetical protein